MRGVFSTAWGSLRKWLSGLLGLRPTAAKRIHAVRERPFSRIGNVAIAIKAIDDSQRHVGILHRSEQERKTTLLHLAWDHQLRENDPDSSYLWIDPMLPPRRARQLAAKCRQVARANGRFVPYGFSPPNDSFDAQTGKLIFGPTHTGLTCSSFVLAVFEFARIRLVDYRSWPSREDDSIWQRRIIDTLRQHGADESRIDALERQVGSARYRPEEVAGAASIFPPKAKFPGARSAAELVLQKLAEL